MIKKIIPPEQYNQIRNSILPLFNSFRLNYNRYFPIATPKSIAADELKRSINFDLADLTHLNSIMPPKKVVEGRHTLDRSLKRAEKFLGILAKPPHSIGLDGLTVADIGCGRGTLGIYAVMAGASKVVSFDTQHRLFMKFSNNEEMNEKIREKIYSCRFDVSEDNNSEYIDHFDVAMSYNTFEHVGDPKMALKNIASMVKKGGYFIARFGPLFNSPFGPHRWEEINIPYVQHLFPDEVVFEYIYHNLSKEQENRYESNYVERSLRTGDPYSHVNRWSAKNFYELFENSSDWQVLDMQPGFNFSSSWMTNLFPNKLKDIEPEELFTASLFLLLQRR